MENIDDIKKGLIQAVVVYAREKFEEKIDAAYEYFFEEEYPEDFLSGISLDLSFINFEDWLICDYQTPEGASIIDMFLLENEGLTDDERNILTALKSSVISLYEVVSPSPDIVLKDIFLGGEIRPEDNDAFKGLEAGNVFAARFIEINGKPSMSGCVYPYGASMKEKVLKYVDKQFGRYIKKDNPKGTKPEFLKKYSDVFNVIWINSLLDVKQKED